MVPGGDPHRRDRRRHARSCVPAPKLLPAVDLPAVDITDLTAMLGIKVMFVVDPEGNNIELVQVTGE